MFLQVVFLQLSQGLIYSDYLQPPNKETRQRQEGLMAASKSRLCFSAYLTSRKETVTSRCCTSVFRHGFLQLLKLLAFHTHLLRPQRESQPECEPFTQYPSATHVTSESVSRDPGILFMSHLWGSCQTLVAITMRFAPLPLASVSRRAESSQSSFRFQQRGNC